MPEHIPSRIEELKKRLYQREDPNFSRAREGFPEQHPNVPTSWDNTTELPKQEMVSISFLKRLLVASVVFFVGVVAFSAYVFFGGGNVLSPDKIDISVNGPVSVKGGDPLSLDIILENHNNVPLENTQLVIKYPPGTRYVEDFSKEQLRYQKYIGELKSGGSHTETVKAVLFGAEQSTSKITVVLEYSVPGSHAVYPKEKEFSIMLTSAPVSLSTTFPKEVTSGAEVIFTTDLTSNSPDVLRNLLLSVSYPSGFTFKSAEPVPTYGNNIWDIGDLQVAGTRKITVRGIMEGQDEELKAFRVSTGIRDSSNERAISVPYSSTFDTLTIKRPFVDVAFRLGGKDVAISTINTGERVRGDIALSNNLPDIVRDLEVTIGLSGPFVPSSVSPSRGFFQSKNSNIVWTKLENSSLAELAPGATQSLNFNLAAFSLSDLRIAGITNPEIRLALLFRGKRMTTNSQVESFETRIERFVRLNAIASFDAKVLRFTGPLANTGPIPPRVDQESTFTIVFSAGSVLNSLSEGKATAILPSNVRYREVFSPASADLVFDKERNQITWNIGNIKEGAGPEEMALQVAITPSATQADDSPNLMTNIAFSATDAFTEKQYTSNVASLTTRFSSEAGFVDSMSRVMK